MLALHRWRPNDRDRRSCGRDGRSVVVPAFRVCFALLLVVACGQSKRNGGGEEGGAPDETGGSAGSSAGFDGSAPSGGRSSGGTGATNTNGGTGGSNASCGDVTRNGRCAGNVYEWCDYFTGDIARLDCTPLGATCRALENQVNEDESNGCLSVPCEMGESSCEDGLFRQCEDDGILINDCARFGGPGSVCNSDPTSFRCTRPQCSNPNDATCAGDLRLICNEDGLLVIEDCSRCDPAGTCVASAPGSELPVACDRPSWGCEQ